MIKEEKEENMLTPHGHYVLKEKERTAGRKRIGEEKKKEMGL